MTVTWNPIEKPFRLVIVRPVAGIARWHDEVQTFATLAEAESVFNATIKGRFIRAVLHRAENPETWTRNGYWRFIASRKPRARRA